MTIETQSSKARYAGNNAQEFPVPFPVFRPEHLHLYIDATLLPAGAYTVYGLGADSDNVRVVLDSPLAPGSVLTILRLVPLLQPTDLQNGGNFNADVIEYTYDYLEMQIQQLREEVDRAIKVPIGGNDESLSDLLNRLQDVWQLIEDALDQLSGVADNSIINVGDTPRSLVDKLEESAAVTDYGATRNDAKDDTQGFTNAPEFTHIPPGSYSVSADIPDKVFLSLGNVEITGGYVDVSDLSNDTNNKYRKRVLQRLARKFPDYDAVMALLGGNVPSLSPQGMWYDAQCNLYLAYSTAASSVATGVLVVYNEKYAYEKCFLLADYTAESIVVKTEADGYTYIYYRSGDNLHLKKARLDNVANMGLVSGTDTGLEVSANFSYFRGTWLLGSNALLQGGSSNRARSVFHYRDDDLNFKGFVAIPVNVTGFAAETGLGAAYFDIIPKLQGVTLIGSMLCLTHGPYWAPSAAPDTRGLGVSRHSAQGELLDYEVIYAKDFFDYLTRQGYAPTMLEAEGCAWHPRKNALHSLLSINSVTNEGAENAGLLIVSEHDAYGPSFAKNAITYHPTSLNRIETTVMPNTSDNILRNPVTGAPFTTQRELIDFIYAFNLTHFSYHPGFCQPLTPLSDRTKAVTGLIVFTNASNTVMYMDILDNNSARVRLVWQADESYTSWYAAFSTDSVNLSGQARIKAVSNDQLNDFVMLRGVPNGSTSELYIGGGQSGQKACTRQRFYVGAVSQDTGTEQLRLEANKFVPVNNNVTDLGSGGQRWANIYSATALNVGSDRNIKDTIEPIDPKLLAAVSGFAYKSFRLKAAIKEKGEAARTHFGVVAQEVEAAFAAQGLDAFKYGLLGKDEILEETKDQDENLTVKKTGQFTLSARYEELLVLEAASLRNRVETLENALRALSPKP